MLVTVNEYLKDMLSQITLSTKTLSELKDNPGDLVVIKKEILKITGIMRVLTSRINTYKVKDESFVDVAKTMNYFLNSYYFEREIDIMSSLYSQDRDRIKNIRYKILDALNDRKLIEKIEFLIREISD